jgi:hypothetical protein
MNSIRRTHTNHRSNRVVTGLRDRSKVAHKCDRDKEETHG